MPQICSTSHQSTIDAEKRRFLELMKETPEITAREIAKDMRVNLSLVHTRIRDLKSEGRIRYSSPNGRGKWIIIKDPLDFSD